MNAGTRERVGLSERAGRGGAALSAALRDVLVREGPGAPDTQSDTPH